MAEAINYREILEELKKPFEASDIEWRVQSATEKNGKIKVLVIPYVTARAVMNRLDEVVGPFWKDHYELINLPNGCMGFRCILSLKIGDEWIHRQDAAEVTGIEAIKGGHSGALKRAGVKWAIGRYLYELPSYWVDYLPQNGEHFINGNFKINKKDRWLTGYFNSPKLPDWALPAGGGNKQQSTPPASQNNQQPRNNQPSNMQMQGNNQPPATQTQGNNQSTKGLNQNEIKLRQLQAIKNIDEKLQFIGVPENLVPELLKQCSGSTVPYKNASLEALGKLYHALVPTDTYLKNCQEMNLTFEEVMYYANLTLAPQLTTQLVQPYELPFVMNKEAVEKTLATIRELRDPNQQQAV